MFSFKGFFTNDKNTHLEHLEDDIINRGSKGGVNAINFLKSVRDMLAGHSGTKINTTVKWDGAPAIICGVNPENGKFFVGTKSVFNVNPKINYTTADIRRNHSGAVAQKLSVCLAHLSTLNIKQILQGDLLFTNDTKSVSIDGEKMISFTPNTITYAVQASSGIGKKIARAKMGIVFHTMYTGKTIKALNANFGNVRGSGNSRVWVASAAYRDDSGSIMFTKSELSKFDAQIRMAEGSLQRGAKILDEMQSSASNPLSVGFRLKSFFNYYIKSNKGGMGKVKVLQDMFRDYYENILKMEIDARKTDKAKQKYRDILATGLKFINQNKSSLYFAIASHVTLGTAKNTLIQKMNQIQQIGHYIKTGTGYRVTAPEGFVAVDRVAGAVKLVDRLEFSRANFTLPKGWK
jgi:hypothetical protein|tara:strand:+ start:2003 stop:3217 length:1215 start_codon:yes stop_codon:yes gene_type:complete